MVQSLWVGYRQVRPALQVYASEVPTDDEAAAYGRYGGVPSQADLERVFSLDSAPPTLRPGQRLSWSGTATEENSRQLNTRRYQYREPTPAPRRTGSAGWCWLSEATPTAWLPPVTRQPRPAFMSGPDGLARC
jgi:hypothetical protein